MIFHTCSLLEGEGQMHECGWQSVTILNHSLIHENLNTRSSSHRIETTATILDSLAN